MMPLSHGFIDELEKIALPRYEREIAAGNITRQGIDPSALPGELPGILNIPQRKSTRQALAAPTEQSAESLARNRQMAGHLYRAQAPHHEVVQQFHPGTGPATAVGTGTVLSPPSAGRFAQRAAEGPVGMLRATVGTFGNIPGAHPKIKQIADRALGAAGPADATLTHAIMRHELGERAVAGSGTIRPFASHLGVTPILEEQMAMRSDPVAQTVVGKIRTNPDDALVQRAIRQVGGIGDRPLAIGGRQERAVNRILDRNVSKLTPAARGAAIKFEPLMAMAGKSSNIGYLPKDMETPSHTMGRLAPRIKELVNTKNWRGLLGPAVKDVGSKLLRANKFISRGI
jgi:hypothetical protein